jgi:hypothetical protein
VEELLDRKLVDALRHVADRLGVKGPMKRVYRRLIGDPDPAKA